MAENRENSKNFKPNEKQIAFLELYLSQEVRRSIEDMSNEVGINPATYYLWRRNPAFNEWFYDQIQVNKHRYAPAILSNLFTQATTTTDKGTIELALKVLDLYTPTSKNINENHNMDYRAFIETIKKKANELSSIEITESGEITDSLDAG